MIDGRVLSNTEFEKWATGIDKYCPSAQEVFDLIATIYDRDRKIVELNDTINMNFDAAVYRENIYERQNLLMRESLSSVLYEVESNYTEREIQNSWLLLSICNTIRDTLSKLKGESAHNG